jgi:hypothetical protein
MPSRKRENKKDREIYYKEAKKMAAKHQQQRREAGKRTGV